MIDLPVLAFLAVVWVIGVAVPSYRTFRFFAFLASASALIVVAAAFSPRLRDIVRLGAVVGVGVGVIIAERIGLVSMTSAELRLDRDLVRAKRLAGSTADSRRTALSILDERLEDVAVDDRWRPAIRMLRRAWSKLSEPDDTRFISPTPSRSFSLAAARYLNDLRTRRTIGFRPRSGFREESMALRAYLDDVRLAMPPGAIGPDETRPGGWSETATTTITELRRVPFRDPDVLRLRDHLADLLEMEIRMCVSAPTAADQGAYDQLAALVDELWRRIDAR